MDASSITPQKLMGSRALEKGNTHILELGTQWPRSEASAASGISISPGAVFTPPAIARLAKSFTAMTFAEIPTMEMTPQMEARSDASDCFSLRILDA